MVYAINKDLDEMGDEADDTRLSEDEVAAFEAKGESREQAEIAAFNAAEKS